MRPVLVRLDENDASKKIRVGFLHRIALVHGVKKVVQKIPGLFYTPCVGSLIGRDTKEVVVTKNIAELVLFTFNHAWMQATG
jgi:hypothetical protein